MIKADAHVRDALKKLRLRASILFLLISFFILVDEALKEGYVFDPYDVVVPWITHEKLFLLFLVLGLVLGLRRRNGYGR